MHFGRNKVDKQSCERCISEQNELVGAWHYFRFVSSSTASLELLTMRACSQAKFWPSLCKATLRKKTLINGSSIKRRHSRDGAVTFASVQAYIFAHSTGAQTSFQVRLSFQ